MYLVEIQRITGPLSGYRKYIVLS